MTRYAPAAALLVLLAACDGGSSFVDRLTPQEVAGTYNVCRLRFRPENTAFPVADLLTSVMDSTPPSGRPDPTLALSSSSRQYDLVYTRSDDGFLQQLRGSTEMGASTVTPRFYQDQAGAVAAEAPPSTPCGVPITPPPREFPRPGCRIV
jgi:hypothetical protein